MATKQTEPVTWDSSVRDGIDLALFDEWDEAAEEAAIAQAAAAADVRYIILEGRVFVARFPDGAIVKAPLDISLADLDALTAEFDNPVDQAKALLERVGEEGSADVLAAQPLPSVVIFAERYFGVFERIAMSAVGKPKP